MLAEGLKKYKLVMRSVPALSVTIFTLAALLMNLLGNKELFNSTYVCVNTGLVFSWVSFLCMDVICKRFGAAASVCVNVTSMVIVGLTCVAFKLLMMIPGRWSAMFAFPDVATQTAVNSACDATFGGTWYIVFWSAAAMLISGIVNSVLNVQIGKKVDKNGTYGGFTIRSAVSTVIGQWVDNMIFTVAVNHVLFGWDWKQTIIGASIGMIFEFIIEMVFSPIGYRIAKGWERDKVGEEYLKTLEG